MKLCLSRCINAVGLFAASVALTLIAGGPMALGQAKATATRSTELAPFGEFADLNPDYGPTRNNGGVFGLDFTKFFRFPIVPSLEFRYEIAPGSTVRENVAMVGLKMERRYGRLHPWLNVLVGKGVIHYQHPGLLQNGQPYTSDDSNVYNYGGGVDINATPRFALRVEYQGQHWNLGGTDVLTPSYIGVGVLYRIKFGERYTK